MHGKQGEARQIEASAGTSSGHGKLETFPRNGVPRVARSDLERIPGKDVNARIRRLFQVALE
jgi:hypothetical protein